MTADLYKDSMAVNKVISDLRRLCCFFQEKSQKYHLNKWKSQKKID